MKMINLKLDLKHKSVLCVLFVLTALVLLVPKAEAARLPDPRPLANPADCYEANIYYGEVPPGHEDGEVLVFVHGYSGKALDWWFFNFATGLNDMYERAYKAGYRTAFLDVNVNPANSTCETLRQPVISTYDSGNVISHQLDYILQHYNVDKVSVIAHSKGGVDTQTAIIFNGAAAKIRNVFTLSSPHQGELLSDLIWSELGELLGDIVTVVERDEGTRTLRINNMSVFRLYADEQPINDQVNYFTAAGNGWQGSGGVTEISGLVMQNLGYDNDGIVTVDSAYLPYAPIMFIGDWSHAEMYQGYNVFSYINAILRGAPQSVAISGPGQGAVNSPYSFLAETGPITLTRPVTYTWNVTDQPTLIRQEGLEDSISFSWDTPGSKTVSVTASNRWGATTSHFTIDISAAAADQAPTSVVISGPGRAAAGSAQAFTASVAPVNAGQDISYTWTATDLADVVHVGGSTDAAELTWTTPGTKNVVVSVSNAAGDATSAAFVVEVGVPPSQVTLQGPAILESNSGTTFTATISPANITGPITYTWRAVDHEEISHTLNIASDSQVYNWEYTAPQAVAVMVENAWGKAVDFLSVQVVTSPEAVSIEGEVVGVVNTSYDFTAVVHPVDTTAPLTYTWESTGDPDALLHIGGAEDVGTFSWDDPGSKYVAVIVENMDNFAPTRFDLLPLTIFADSPDTPPESVSITGAETGLVDTPYRFVASILPITTTQSITYTWQVSGRDPVTQLNGAKDALEITWDEGGTYDVMVAATNAFGTVTNQMTIVINAPVTSVAVSGPTIGLPNTSYEFTASAVPITATQPITFTWYTPETGQETVVGGSSDAKSYSWPAGTHVVAVTAENKWGWFTQPVVVEIGDELTELALTGPGLGAVGVNQTFAATVLPASALSPITYTWSTPGQTPFVQVGDLTNSASFAWDSPGPKTVTVSAVDPFGATANQSFTILVGNILYTPVMMRGSTVSQADAGIQEHIAHVADSRQGQFMSSVGKIAFAVKPFAGIVRDMPAFSPVAALPNAGKADRSQ